MKANNAWLRGVREPMAKAFLLMLAVAVVTGLPSPAVAQEQSVALGASSTQLARLGSGVQSGSLTFTVDGAARTLMLNIASTTPIVTELTLPGGARVTESNVGSFGGTFFKTDATASTGPLLYPLSGDGFQYVYRIPVTSQGPLAVRFNAPVALSADAAVVAQLFTDSPVVTNLMFTETVGVVGRPSVLVAMVFDGGTRVAGAAVQARVFAATGSVQSVTLRDDGSGADGAAGDGLYSGVFTPAATGTFSALAEISGTASSGAFRRQSGAEIAVVANTAALTGAGRGRGIDLNANGAFDRVAVDADISVTMPGTYRLFAHLRAAGRTLIGSGEVTVTAGARTATAFFDTSALLAEGLGQGPYTVDVLELHFVEPDRRSVDADRRIDAGTISVDGSFERPPLRLTGVFSETAVDLNANSLFDELRVSVQIDVQVAGYYDFSGRLTDGQGTLLAVGAGYGELNAGLNTVTLAFVGREIGIRGISGPYSVDGLLVTDNGWNDGVVRSLSVLGEVARTRAYAYTQFEGAARNPGDVDNSGRVDCVDVGIVRTALGTRTGTPGFDARADVDRNGVVDNADLSAVTARLPVGTVCPVTSGWASRTSASDLNWQSVAHDGAKFVAVGRPSGSLVNAVMTSPDGDTWTNVPHNLGARNINDVLYAKNLFVAVASDNVGVTNGGAMYSTNGTTWTNANAPRGDWQSVAFGNGTFVAVASFTVTTLVMTSTDGINWTSRTPASTSNSWRGVAFGNGLFVAVAAGAPSGNPSIMTSPDGITWTGRSPPGNLAASSVAFGNGMFVAVAQSGAIITSPDGITWTTRSVPAANAWRDVAFGNGRFVAVAASGSGNRVVSSTDGITWTAETSAADNNWRGVTYANGRFVAVADTGAGNRVMISVR